MTTPSPTSLLVPSPPIRPSSAPPNFSPEGIQLNFVVECQARARIPSDIGKFYLHLYRNNHDQKEHLAITYGEDLRSTSLDAPRPGETEMDRIVRGAYVGRLNPDNSISKFSSHPSSVNLLLPPSPASSPPPYQNRNLSSSTPSGNPPLVRIHSECFTGETLGSRRCDCGEQLVEAMRMMRKEGRGVVVYLRQEGRGIGLLDKLRAYNLQDLGHDTVTANLMLAHPADGRTYGAASQILSDLGAKTVRLLTNNPDKLEQLQDLGISVAERVPMIPKAWRSQTGMSSPDLRRDMAEVDGYLKAKVERMRHLLDLPLDLASAVIKADVVKGHRTCAATDDEAIASDEA